MFSARLREELDLDTLSAELLLVVEQAMQPTTASLWLRPRTSLRPPSTPVIIKADYPGLTL